MNNNSITVPLFAATLDSSKHIYLSQLYASMVLQQTSLDIQTIDIGLATEIDYYHKRFSGAVNSILFAVPRDFIKILTDASNFCNFYEKYANNSIINIKNAYKDEADKINAAGGIRHPITLANQLIHTLQLVIVQEETVLKDLEIFMPSYEKSIDASIELLHQSAKQLSTKIELLGKDASDAIKAIVSGGKEVGTAVSTLGVGVLTTISGGLKPPSKEDNPKSPNVDFVVQSITLASSGASTMTAASKKLQQVNLDLAVAYKELAKQNTLVAIAKVIQVQNKMYYDILKQTLVDLKSLLEEWTNVFNSFEALHTSITNIKTQDEANHLASFVMSDHKQWVSLFDKLGEIKKDLTNFNLAN